MSVEEVVANGDMAARDAGKGGMEDGSGRDGVMGT